MMASQFCKSCESCQRKVTGCLATFWMVQKASWSQFDPGKTMTPNFIGILALTIGQKCGNSPASDGVVAQFHDTTDTNREPPRAPRVTEACGFRLSVLYVCGLCGSWFRKLSQHERWTRPRTRRRERDARGL